MKTQKIFLLLPLVLSFMMVSPEYGWCWHGYVVKVLDGDSLRVKKGGKVYEIRLYGIDTPEYGQRYRDQAKRFTKARTYKKTVSIEQKDVDQYGRIVALVKSQGRLVNRELVKDGLAWVYPKYCRDTKLCNSMKKDEKKARKAKRGLWKDKNPLPPWKWRLAKKKGSPLGFHREYRLPNWR